MVGTFRSAPSQVDLVRENLPLPEVSARIVEEGTKVWAPIGRRGDGEWDGRHQVIAIFLEPGEAEGYVAAKVATGLPAYVE